MNDQQLPENKESAITSSTKAEGEATPAHSEIPSNVISMSEYLSKRKKKPRILIADGSQTNLDLFSKALSYAGYVVICAQSGDIALDLLENNQFDLMLLDNHLPDVSGLDIAKMHQIFSLGNAKKIPVVILNTNSNPLDKNHGNTQYADAILANPVVDENLIATVETFVKK